MGVCVGRGLERRDVIFFVIGILGVGKGKLLMCDVFRKSYRERRKCEICGGCLLVICRIVNWFYIGFKLEYFSFCWWFFIFMFL